MSHENLVEEIDAALRRAGSPERARQEKRYLKSELMHLGASVPMCRAITKQVRRIHPILPRDTLLHLVETLWAEPIHERRLAAVLLLDAYGDCLVCADQMLIERILRASRTWALVDALSTSVLADLIQRFPDLGGTLDSWARDPDFWVRRAALLALLPALRKGGGDFNRFARYADAMLDDREFFVQKAIGWVLRETSKLRPELVVSWVTPRAARLSRVALREALKRLPQGPRAAILEAREGGATASRSSRRSPTGRVDR